MTPELRAWAFVILAGGCFIDWPGFRDWVLFSTAFWGPFWVIGKIYHLTLPGRAA